MTHPKYFQDLDHRNILHGVFSGPPKYPCPECEERFIMEEFHNGRCQYCAVQQGYLEENDSPNGVPF